MLGLQPPADLTFQPPVHDNAGCSKTWCYDRYLGYAWGIQKIREDEVGSLNLCSSAIEFDADAHLSMQERVLDVDKVRVCLLRS
jgi:hypothetical protein